MATDDKKIPTYELKDNGEVRYNKDGQSSLLAKYDAASGRLTFDSFSIDQKHRHEIVAAVSQDPFTGRQSGRTVKTYAIAGRPVDKRRTNEPPQPKKNMNMGDKTPEFVKWLFKWRPQAAYARYGVLLDSNGEPQTAHCHRTEQGLLMEDNGKAMKIFGDGKDALSSVYIEKEDGILAMRATCMTFLKEEKVGWTAEDSQNEEDMEPDVEAAGVESAGAKRTAKPSDKDDE